MSCEQAQASAVLEAEVGSYEFAEKVTIPCANHEHFLSPSNPQSPPKIEDV